MALCFFSAISSAEVICRPRDPHLVPLELACEPDLSIKSFAHNNLTPLQDIIWRHSLFTCIARPMSMRRSGIADGQVPLACNYAIRRLAYATSQCSFEPAIFTAYSRSPEAVHLPLAFLGQGWDYTPTSPLWCTLLILWQPRPGSRLPPPTLADLFPYRRLLEAAEAIRDICWGGDQGASLLPAIGRAWILPNEWVDVQFGAIVGRPSLGGKMNVSKEETGEMRVLLADGSNRTLVASKPNVYKSACGGLLGHAGEHMTLSS